MIDPGSRLFWFEAGLREWISTPGGARVAVGLVALYALSITYLLVPPLRILLLDAGQHMNLFLFLLLVGAAFAGFAIIRNSLSAGRSLLGLHLLLVSTSGLVGAVGASDDGHLTGVFGPLFWYVGVMTVAATLLRSRKHYELLRCAGLSLLVAILVVYMEYDEWADYLYAMLLVVLVNHDWFGQWVNQGRLFRDDICDVLKRAGSMYLSGFDVAIRIVASFLFR